MIFEQPTMEGICRILGGYASGSQITTYLLQSNIDDIDGPHKQSGDVYILHSLLIKIVAKVIKKFLTIFVCNVPHLDLLIMKKILSSY